MNLLLHPLELHQLAPGLRLAQPLALLLLLLLPWWLFTVRRGQRRLGGLTFAHTGLLARLPVSPRVRLLPLPDLLRVVVLACLILALARPQLGREREKITQRGVDIMLALDVSGSMYAEDIEPNRIQAAKRTIRRFIGRLTTDRVGLVVFAGRSFTQAPLTTDYGILGQLVAECQIGMVEVDGTAIGDALATAIYRLTGTREEAAERPREDADQSRVVVLLTDGYNNSGRVTPHDAALMARVKNVKVHCIGLGSVDGAPIPYTTLGGQRLYATDPNTGQLLITKMDEGTLRDIAEVTGGKYFRATNAAGLESIYRQIAAMEQHDIEVERQVHYEERFAPLVILALGLLLLELLLRSTVLRIAA